MGVIPSSPGQGVHRSGPDGGTAIQPWMGRYPHRWMGVPLSSLEHGVPNHWMGGRVPHPALDGGTPRPRLDGVHPHKVRGTPASKAGWGTPHLDLDLGWGTPPPHPLGQQKEYSLHGGLYASCIHAGLSSYCVKFTWNMEYSPQLTFKPPTVITTPEKLNLHVIGLSHRRQIFNVATSDQYITQEGGMLVITASCRIRKYPLCMELTTE